MSERIIRQKDLTREVQKLFRENGVEVNLGICDDVVYRLLMYIRQAVYEGAIVKLHNFGSFFRYLKKESTHTDPRNPKGEKMVVPAKYVPRFTPFIRFKEQLKNLSPEEAEN